VGCRQEIDWLASQSVRDAVELMERDPLTPALDIRHRRALSSDRPGERGLGQATPFAGSADALAERPVDVFHRPSCVYAAADEAREVTEQLIRDAGYDPVSVGGLENARALEDFVPGVLGQIGRVFYRFAPAGEL